MPGKIPGIDIYRSANLLIDQHGESAAIEAAMRADKLLSTGDLDGKRVWQRATMPQCFS